MVNLTERLQEKIIQSFSNATVQVNDLTGEGNHLELFLVSARFENLSRIARQQLVMSEIKELWAEGLHALTMKTLTPAEWEAQKK